MTKTISLKNDFHNSEVLLYIADGKNISKGQVKKTWKTLCGIKGCTCGNELGMRGYGNPQIEVRQDGSAYLVDVE